MHRCLVTMMLLMTLQMSLAMAVGVQTNHRWLKLDSRLHRRRSSLLQKQKRSRKVKKGKLIQISLMTGCADQCS